MIIPKNVKENTHSRLLEESIKYCETVGASELYNVAYLGDGDYRIMYFMGELPKRKMSAVLLKTNLL